MKTFTLPIILCFFLSFCSFAQQIELKGNVTVHNSKYRTGKIKYVENAQVSAPFTSPTTTDNRGNFNLTFVGMEGGTAVDIKLEASGWEVVNTHDLTNTIIGRKFPLRIAVDTKGRLAESQTEFYNISKKALYAAYERQVAVLEKDGIAKDELIAKLNEELDLEIWGKNEAIHELKKQLKEAEKRLPNFAKELAYVNLDFASDLYIEAYELFQNGKVQEALILLDNAKLEKAATDAVKAIETGKQVTEKGLEEIHQILKSYQLKADAYLLLFEYQKAAEIYEKIIVLIQKIETETETKYIDIYRLAGENYIDLGKYQKAQSYLEKNLELIESNTSYDSLYLVTAYNNLALVHRKQENYQEALTFQRKAITIAEQITAISSMELASVYDALGTILGKLGESEAAQQNHLKGLALLKNSLHPDSTLLAIVYDNLSIIYTQMGEYDEALNSEEKAIEIYKQLSSENQPPLALAYHQLAMVYDALGDFEKAIEIHKKAIELKQQFFDKNHPEVGRFYNNIAVTYIRMDSLEKAINYIKKSLLINKIVFGEFSVNVAQSYNSLATIYENTSRYDSALIYQLDAIKIFEEKLGENDQVLASNYANLAIIYQGLEQYDNALKTHEKALSIRKQTLEPNHPDFISSYHGMAYLYYEMGALDDAIKYEEKAYQQGKQLGLPESHPYQELFSYKIALYYEKRGQNAFLANEYQTALIDFTQALKTTDDSTGLYNLIGQCYDNLENYEQAISFYEKSYQSDTSTLKTYLNNVGLVALKVGNNDKAKSCFEKLEQLYPKDAWVYRNWAIYHAKLGEMATSLNNLEKAIDLGYKDWIWLTSNEWLENIRRKERFQKIIRRLHKNIKN